jgi:hypothetical protein
MNKERKKIPLVYIPYGILTFDKIAICQNPELVTGRKDSMCVVWGKKYKILHCWAPAGHEESDWLRGEVQYLVEIEPTEATGRFSQKGWISWWQRFVYEMSEDAELYPIIIVSSKEHLDRLQGRRI